MDEKYSRNNVIQLEATLKKIFHVMIDKEYPIDDWEVRKAKYIGPQNYKYLEDWTNINLGDKWVVDPEITAFFHAQFELPMEFRDKNVYLNLKVGGEGLLYINGSPYHGLDRNRSFIKLDEQLKSEETLDLLIEASVDRQTYAFQDRYWADVKYGEHEFSAAKVVIMNQTVWDYYFDLMTAKEFYKNLQESELKDKYFAGLKDSMMAIDFIHGRQETIKSIENAKNILNDRIKDIQIKLSQSNIHLIGHSHIDVAYLWPIKETVRKSSRTFSTALRLMDQYSHYKFIQSQPLLYKFIKTNYPDIYEGIKKKIKGGQWEVEGAMWVEPDCNLPSGESLIRQILIGKTFMEEEFGVDSVILWLPDTFGFTWTLPQIMKGCGIKYFVTQKIRWNKINTFPYNLFKWKSADGSEVLSLFTGTYNGKLSGEEVYKKYMEFGQVSLNNDYPLLYGFGDGGGGVTLEMLETAKRLEQFNKLAHFKTSFPSELLADLQEINNLPAWEDELYLEAHRGTYTSEAELKRLNRKSERTIRDVEFFLSISLLDKKFYQDKLREIWEKILTNQFHDTLSGSIIKEAFDEAVHSYKEALEEAQNLEKLALNSISKEVTISMNEKEKREKYYTIWNTLSWERKDIAQIQLDETNGYKTYKVFDEEGVEIPSQILKGESPVIVFPVDLPSMGYKVYKVLMNESLNPIQKTTDIQKGLYSLETKYYKIDFDGNGDIEYLLDKTNKREVLPKGKKANVFQIFVDEPQQYDAWEVEEFDSQNWYEDFELENIHILEDGPVVKKMRIVKRWNESEIVQNVVLYENIPRIDFETEVDWKESRKLLKVAFPVDITTREATYDIAYGTIKRSTHNNTSWDRAKFEVPAHMWADLSEYGYGVSLLNDCKYGYDIKGNTMRLSLLKAPINPDPKADRGKHYFVYSLYPHGGSWQEGETEKQAYQLNTPLTILEDKISDISISSNAFLKVDSNNVLIEAVKPAEDGNGIIIRLLEKYGKQSTVNVGCGMSIKKVIKCNMLEKDQEEVECNSQGFSYLIRPYKIETFRLVFQ